MVTTLYLVRHGETEGSESKRYKGSIDVPLSEKGIEQIRKTSELIRERLQDAGCSKYASYLKDVHKTGDKKEADNNLHAVYCSGLGRALKSAEIIAEPHGINPVIVHDLRERSFGIWEGMTFSEIKESHPKEFEAWAGNPLKYSPIGGENTLGVRDRVVTALDNILSNHEGKNISIVAHGGVNRIILCHIMGIPLENIFRIEQDFGAINIIEFWEKYPVVKALNLTAGYFNKTC